MESVLKSCIAKCLLPMVVRNKKQTRKLSGVGVGRIRTFPFSSNTVQDSFAMIQRNQYCGNQGQKWEIKAITRPRVKHCDWLILLLLFLIPANYLVFTGIEAIQNQCFAFNSGGWIQTRLSHCASDYNTDYNLPKIENSLSQFSVTITLLMRLPQKRHVPPDTAEK